MFFLEFIALSMQDVAFITVVACKTPHSDSKGAQS